MVFPLALNVSETSAILATNLSNIPKLLMIAHADMIAKSTVNGSKVFTLESTETKKLLTQ